MPRGKPSVRKESCRKAPDMSKVIQATVITAIGISAVTGCGYGTVHGRTPAQDTSLHATDIPAMKNAALSSLANGSQCVASIGGGCMAELTTVPALQCNVSDTLCRYADTNDTGVGWAILMSVEDGAVLALADCGGDADAPRPFALTRLFMPGHLISSLTVAAALDAGIATPHTELFTKSSEAFLYEYKLPSDGGYAWESTLSLSNALVYASNVVLTKLETLVGLDKEYDVLNKFGVGIKSGTGFPNEPVGRLILPERWCSLQRTMIPIGQSVEITAIQVARAYATLANHGVRVDPYVVKRIANAAGETLYEHTASTNKVQAVSRKAADSTCAILEGAVKADDLKGLGGVNDEYPPDVLKALVPPRATGRRAAVQGVRIAGETSTIQRMKPDSYEYETDRYISSFAGFFPAEDPKYVLVVCYETKRVEGIPYIHQGGGRPAMAFAEVVKRMGYGKQMDCKQ